MTNRERFNYDCGVARARLGLLRLAALAQPGGAFVYPSITASCIRAPAAASPYARTNGSCEAR